MRPLVGWVTLEGMKTLATLGPGALLVALLAGCSSEPDASGGAEPAAQADTTPASGQPFEVEEIDDLDEPWAMTFLPGSGDLLVTERSGTLHLRDTETGERVEVSGTPDVVAAGQGGLGDVVASPTFADDGAVYLSWVEAGDGGTGAVVGRGTLETGGDEPALTDLEVLWRQTPKVSGNGHFSHRIAFDPDGEHLFVTSGERQQKTPAQDTSNTLGTVVRLTLDGDPAPGNPLADDGSPSDEIWSWGHRNPLGIDFAADGTLWSSEMGPEGGDELNVIVEGENYGWPEVSNGSDYGGGEIPDHAEGDGFTAPEAFWTPSISPSSLVIYDGDLFPDWKGDALIGALSGEALVHVELDGTSAGDDTVHDMGQRIREVEQAPDGSVWVLEDAPGGRLLRLTPASA